MIPLHKQTNISHIAVVCSSGLEASNTRQSLPSKVNYDAALFKAGILEKGKIWKKNHTSCSTEEEHLSHRHGSNIQICMQRRSLPESYTPSGNTCGQKQLAMQAELTGERKGKG